MAARRRTINILLDEHISPRVVERLAQLGIFAQCVSHIGLSGKSDPDVWQYAFRHDQVVVTANAGDYLTLAAGSEAHAGLIVLRGHGLTAEEQWLWLEPVISHLKTHSIDLLNHAVEVRAIGRYEIRLLPLP